MKWEIRAERFVLFLDILGFKDLVNRESHSYIFEKLTALTNAVKSTSDDVMILAFKTVQEDIDKDQTRSITFSDSIILFSCGNSKIDAFKILCDAHAIQLYSLEHGVPLKGAISFGDISVDFEKSLFFGQPIIDAFLLHEDLSMLSIVLDHRAENRFALFKDEIKNYENLVKYQVPMKYGSVEHCLVRLTDFVLPEALKNLEKLYNTASGRPRMYIDNTRKFFASLNKEGV